MDAAGPAARTRTHVPGEPGLWVLILGDLLAFSAFFGVFMYHRAQRPALYAASQTMLGAAFGLFNTLLLLTSSWFVALAVAAARSGTRPRVLRLLLAAIGCGAAFVASKALEWGSRIAQGITLNTDEFFTFYYMLTGFHLVHVLIGIAVLGYLFNRSRRPEPGPGYAAVMEGGAAFWHLVDLLWVLLFAVLYLVK